MDELRPGLWTWTAPHPEWTPEEGGPDGWDEIVRSYAVDTREGIVLLDPLDPPPGLAAPAVAVVLTCAWHGRSAAALAADGKSVYAPAGDDAPETPARRFGVGDKLPGAIGAQAAVYPGEVVLWLRDHGALVAGDSLLNRGGQLVAVPESWLPEGASRETVQAALRPLLELPVELVLPTHGDPVLEDAREALRAALGA